MLKTEVDKAKNEVKSAMALECKCLYDCICGKKEAVTKAKNRLKEAIFERTLHINPGLNKDLNCKNKIIERKKEN